MSFPFARTKPNPKRDDPRRVRDREILRTKTDKEARRREIFKRSGGNCEVEWDGVRCNVEITWTTMQWSHNRHAANKSDAAKDGLAACGGCHGRQHNAGGKPCPKRPGRVMKLAEAMRYWKGDVCFCSGKKLKETAFCLECRGKLTPQQCLDLDELKNAEWLKSVADCEMTILRSGLVGR